MTKTSRKRLDDESVPSMSDRGLRYVLHHVYKGNYEAAATYLLDECGGGKGAGNARSALEGRAEAFDMREREEKRKEETARMRAEQEKKETERELEVLKKQIVGRYADEVNLVEVAVQRSWVIHILRGSLRSSR